MATFVVETMNPEIESQWRRVGTDFKKRRDAEDEMEFFRGRNPLNKYRVVDTDARDTPAPHAPMDLPSRTNWRKTIYLVRNGPDDYWDRFAAQYPEVFAQVQRVIDFAGNSVDDARLLQAAGGLLADMEDWARRARKAMKERKAIQFDALAHELSDIIGGD